MRFPDKENKDMPDRIWETYCCLVWCNNSLNADAGRLKYVDPNASDHMLRAQWVITHLLEESGRMKEFYEWEKRKEITYGRL